MYPAQMRADAGSMSCNDVCGPHSPSKNAYAWRSGRTACIVTLCRGGQPRDQSKRTWKPGAAYSQYFDTAMPSRFEASGTVQAPPQRAVPCGCCALWMLFCSTSGVAHSWLGGALPSRKLLCYVRTMAFATPNTSWNQ